MPKTAVQIEVRSYLAQSRLNGQGIWSLLVPITRSVCRRQCVEYRVPIILGPASKSFQ